MTKVLVVHNAYQSHQIGGEDIVVKREIYGLAEALGPSNVFQYIISNDEIRFLSLARTLWGNRKHYEQIKRLIVAQQIDIVHVHNFFPLLTPLVFLAAKKAGAKVIHTLHNFRWWCLAGTFYRQNKICERCSRKKFAWPGFIHACYRQSKIQSLAAMLAFAWYRFKGYEKNIDAYFVLSLFQRDKLRSLLPAHRVLLKYNPIDEPTYLIPANEKRDYIFVGRLEAAKGIDLLLKIWQQLPKHFVLKVIGSGENDVSLTQRFAQSNIHFLGQLDHATTLHHINQAKYLIQSSLSYETFGLTLFEAMAHGTPVIGFDKGTRREFIQSGSNGFLASEMDLKLVIEQANDFIHYEQLSKNALLSAKQFSLSSVIAQQIAFYEKIMRRAADE